VASTTIALLGGEEVSRVLLLLLALRLLRAVQQVLPCCHLLLQRLLG
jgi:hypothetical protein